MLDEWEQIQAGLVDGIAALSEEEWRSAPSWPTREALDLGGMLEEIIVTPPRPLYRHLPVHVPDSAAYIRSPAVTVAATHEALVAPFMQRFRATGHLYGPALP